MNIAERILHVGGRNNELGYIEFGSIQAVKALTEVRRAKGKSVSIDGVQYRSCGEAAEALNTNYITIYNRCSKDLPSYQNWFFI